MIIAHVCPYYTPVIGGVKQVVEELVKRQVSTGNVIHVYTSDWDKEKRIEVLNETIDGVHVHRCKHWLRVSDFSTVWPSVYKKLLKIKPDIIHTHVTGHLHTWLGMRAARKLKVPLVVTTHCPWESKRSLMGKIANWISYKFFPVLNCANAVVAITPWEHEFLKDEGVAKDKIHTIPNGMSSEFFEQVKPNKFRDKHNISITNKIVLFFGRLNYTKNPLMFLNIAEAILHDKNDVTFVLMGPDEGELGKVEEKIEEMPSYIKKNIRLLPPTRDRKEVVEMYQGSDVYVMPSLREGNPLCMYEAFASGLPVIASNVNGIPYGLTDKENGFLLEPNDIDGFVEKVNLLLDNDRARKMIAINNIFKAKGYDWDLICKKTMGVYNEIL